MNISNVNKFTFPLLFNKGILSSFTIAKKIKTQPVILGRWNLKHEEKELNKFYRYIPDPGYPNIYPDSKNAGYEPQYNRSGKRQN